MAGAFMQGRDKAEQILCRAGRIHQLVRLAFGQGNEDVRLINRSCQREVDLFRERDLMAARPSLISFSNAVFPFLTAMAMSSWVNGAPARDNLPL